MFIKLVTTCFSLTWLLGRRIMYDYDKFGDSPICLSQVEEQLEGKEAYVEGYGLTEHGQLKMIAAVAYVVE